MVGHYSDRCIIKLARVRATDIANAIVSMSEELGLSLGDLRGQGYNGASTMSGKNLAFRSSCEIYNPKLCTLIVLGNPLILQ